MEILKNFTYEGTPVRTISRDGEPWFVAADVARILEIGNPSQAVSRLDEDERDTLISNEGRQTGVVNEPGLYSLILGSRKPEAKTFKRWVTHEVIPSIRRTGRYEVAPAPAPAELSRMEILQLAMQAETERAQAVERAEKAEEIVTAVNSNRGLNLRKFHKHYFPDVPEREFFELLYSAGLLIDQRRSRWSEKKQKFVNGHEHMHPTYKGKPYFMLDGPIIDEVRRERTFVRPGQPEVDLRDLLIRKGLPIPATKELISA